MWLSASFSLKVNVASSLVPAFALAPSKVFKGLLKPMEGL
jgi:hypothetical protein